MGGGGAPLSSLWLLGSGGSQVWQCRQSQLTVETKKNITLGQRDMGGVHSGSAPSMLQQG